MISGSRLKLKTILGRCKRSCGLLLTFLGLVVYCWLVPVEADAKISADELIQTMAGFKDRSTGTPGCRKAADLIHQTFVDLGIQKVYSQQFLLPITRYQTASITVKGHRAKIRQVKLNVLHPEVTPPSGIEGPLVYAGSGQLRNFNGMGVEGSIVLMEMESGRNWLNAANLGAKALIYVDRGATFKGVFEEKRELTPIRFPRFWISLSEARSLFGSFETAADGRVAPHVVLTSKGEWHRVTAEHVYGLIQGQDPELKDELLVVEAFYDSTSMVAGLSPGADEASSIASLMDLAKSLKSQPPGRSVLLVATSGHAQTLAGLRELIWAISAKGKEQKKIKTELGERIKQAGDTLMALRSPEPLDKSMGETAKLLREALTEQIKSQVELLSQQLIRLLLLHQFTQTAPTLQDFHLLSGVLQDSHIVADRRFNELCQYLALFGVYISVRTAPTELPEKKPTVCQLLDEFPVIPNLRFQAKPYQLLTEQLHLTLDLICQGFTQKFGRLSH